VLRRLAPMIGLIAGLAPVMAHAQTNIDEGKTPAQIFASDCATCHKSPRGLGSGKGSLLLTGFLREHYTSSREQAAALAAYVLGAGGETAPATPGRGSKPAAERAKLPGEESKPTPSPSRQTGKPEREVPATAKLQPNEAAIPANVPSIVAAPRSGTPGQRPAAARHEGQRASVIRGRRKEPETAQPTPPSVPITAEPAPHQASPQEASPEPTPGPSAAVPANADSGEGALVPRDNIPD